MKPIERRLRRLEQARGRHRAPLIFEELGAHAGDELVAQRAKMLAELDEEGVPYLILSEAELKL